MSWETRGHETQTGSRGGTMLVGVRGRRKREGGEKEGEIWRQMRNGRGKCRGGRSVRKRERDGERERERKRSSGRNYNSRRGGDQRQQRSAERDPPVRPGPWVRESQDGERNARARMRSNRGKEEEEGKWRGEEEKRRERRESRSSGSKLLQDTAYPSAQESRPRPQGA